MTTDQDQPGQVPAASVPLEAIAMLEAPLDLADQPQKDAKKAKNILKARGFMRLKVVESICHLSVSS